jgi:hypothetical protein
LFTVSWTKLKRKIFVVKEEDGCGYFVVPVTARYPAEFNRLPDNEKEDGTNPFQPSPIYTDCVTDLDLRREMITFESILTTFEANAIF